MIYKALFEKENQAVRERFGRSMERIGTIGREECEREPLDR